MATHTEGAAAPENQAQPEQYRPDLIENANVGTVFSDWLIGVAMSGPNLHVLLGEFIYNTMIGAKIPNVRPTNNLIMPFETAKALAEQLNYYIDIAEGRGAK